MVTLQMDKHPTTLTLHIPIVVVIMYDDRHLIIREGYLYIDYLESPSFLTSDR